jgi:hypothetical protein
MRLKNKILIEGDTLRIFEVVDNYHGLKVGDKVKFKDISDGVEYDSIASNKYFVNPDTIYTIIALHPGHPEVPNPNTFATLKALNDPNVKEIKKVYTGYLKKEGITEGDTLSIFEEGMFNSMKGGADLQHIAKVIYDELQQMGSYDSSDRQSLIKQAGLSGKDADTVSDMLFDMDADERYDDMSRYDEAINQYLEEGEEDEIDFDDENFSDPMIDDPDSINEAKKAKTDPAEKKKAEKTNYGHKDMADVDMVNPYELRKGIRIEMVDTDDYEKAMDKAVKKLKKDPIHYSNLIANVKETKGKRADISTEIKDKKLNKVSDKLKDKANEMEVSKKDATKKNANDSLNKKEKASGKPKGVKEMTMKSKSSKGMKSMTVPGKEKKISLKENVNLWEAFKKNILR